MYVCSYNVPSLTHILANLALNILANLALSMFNKIIVLTLVGALTYLAVPASAATSPEGVAWLAAKGKENGVTTLPSGLMYKALTVSESGKTPLAGTPCSCHYAGTLIDGTEFDSSYKRGQPTTFAPNQVIKGWTEAMQLMREGDKWELYIPSEVSTRTVASTTLALTLTHTIH